MKEAGAKPIIKKIKKVQGGGAHGGSWKVAYADFVTAMMAFFLLMWLLNMTSPEKKVQLSEYFKDFSIFDKGGWSLMATGKGVWQDQSGDQARIKELPKMDAEKRPITAAEAERERSKEKLKEAIKEAIQKNLGQFKDQIKVSAQKKDVRIEIMDAEGKPIFPLGGPELNVTGKSILRVICENLKTIQNKITIEGHTDAISFAASRKITNWELSTERANAARRELLDNGVDSSRIAMVAGFAENKPLIKEAPADPRNRRICIVVLGSGSDNATGEDEPEAGSASTTIPDGVPDTFPEDINKQLTAPAVKTQPAAVHSDNEVKRR
ncbi:MAG: flagellar motor protein MotB [Pseudomonadota bacterium]